MNKLIAVLIAGTFALGSVAAMAQLPQGEKTPAQPVDQAKLKADAAAARKAKRAARQQELSATQKSGQEGGASGQAKAAEGAKAAADSKAQPKALPTPADKQKALKEQEKKSSGQ